MHFFNISPEYFADLAYGCENFPGEKAQYFSEMQSWNISYCFLDGYQTRQVFFGILCIRGTCIVRISHWGHRFKEHKEWNGNIFSPCMVKSNVKWHAGLGKPDGSLLIRRYPYHSCDNGGNLQSNDAIHASMMEGNGTITESSLQLPRLLARLIDGCTVLSSHR